MIQLGEPLNRKKTIRCQSCGDRILYVLHDRKAGERLRFQDVRFLQQTTVKNPLFCSKCDSPWINKSTGRLIKATKESLIKAQIKKHQDRKADNDAFKYFKPMIEDCNASKIKPSDIVNVIPEAWADAVRVGKEKKQKPFRSFMVECERMNSERPPIRIKSKAEKEKLISEFRKLQTEARKYFEDSIVVDECKRLTRRQIKESNDALNKLRGKGKKLSDVVTGLDGFCMLGKKCGSK
jgi:hypothetical protein